MEDGEDLVGEFAVAGVADGDDDGVGTEAFGGGHGHGGAAAEGAGFVGGGGDDAARAVVADEDGLAAECGMIKLLDGGEEGVHVEVEDGAGGGGHGGIVALGRGDDVIGHERHEKHERGLKARIRNYKTAMRYNC